MINLALYESFNKKTKKKSSLDDVSNKLTNKQKISLSFFLISLFGIITYANTSPISQDSSASKGGFSFSSIVVGPNSDTFLNWANPLQWVMKAIEYITKAQIDSTRIIASTPIDGSGIFDSIIGGLTILAAIGCFIKLLNHFLSTERFDNVKAFTGFFSYLSILTLFIFSTPLVNYMANLNTEINTANVSNIGNKLTSELDKQIIEDWNKLKAEIAEISSRETNQLEGITIGSTIKTAETTLAIMGFGASNFFKYSYYSIFALIITSVIAMPVVIMTLMVKITLSIMVLGSKIVFLLAFIPGFENAWKTYMQNLLNVLLWVPIFNVIISFIIAIVAGTIVDNSIDTGQIIWLSIVAMILSYQSITLTTTTASTIINGSAAGIAGAMGSMASMNATTIVAGVGAASAATGATIATGGGAGTAIAASKLASDKFSKK